MSKPDLKVVGILTLVEREGEPQTFVVHNPSHAYLLLPPDTCPDAWVQLMALIRGTDGCTPLGVIIDTGESADE